MKKRLAQVVFLLVIGLSILWISGCTSGSGNKSEDKVTFNKEVFNKQIQGVAEYLSPNQGLSAMFDNNFIFIFGDSDTSMVCQKGIYTTSVDTVIFTTKYATNPELVGSVIRWSPRFLEGDNYKAVLFDDNGNITDEIFSVWKSKVDENTIRQLKKFEGSYDYVSQEGGGIILSGYMIYLTPSNGGAGPYKETNDTVTFNRLFCTNPDFIDTETTWVNLSKEGDTLNWAVINKTGEIRSKGQSLY